MKPLIIANWKSNKTKVETLEWFEEFKNNKKEFILCPSFTLLDFLSAYIQENSLGISLGAQNISPFEEGPFTGEVSAKQVKEFASYVLIGHSERREKFRETNEMLTNKVNQAITAGLKVVYFVQDADEEIPKGVEIVVYEPPDSISTVSGGVPNNPEDVERIARAIKQKSSFSHVLYGGSVDQDNIRKYTSLESIDGVVVGNASLNSSSFLKILQNA